MNVYQIMKDNNNDSNVFAVNITTSSNDVMQLLEQGFEGIQTINATSEQEAMELFFNSNASSVMMSTSSFLTEDTKVIANYGIITSTIVSGTNIFRDMLAGVRDIVGGNSQTYMNKLEDLKVQAMNELKKKAVRIDCNAIISVSIDTEEISGQGKGMLMITATGTAVKVKER
ncbi:YbjQ family protein [Psychromonas sp. PT13]|uniref:YbjQ family protein n=1 Tax=Psychromonas sp. PT13 TaxID=3439547 RepID=UPI003EBDA3DC